MGPRKLFLMNFKLEKECRRQDFQMQRAALGALATNSHVWSPWVAKGRAGGPSFEPAKVLDHQISHRPITKREGLLEQLELRTTEFFHIQRSPLLARLTAPPLLHEWNEWNE